MLEYDEDEILTRFALRFDGHAYADRWGEDAARAALAAVCSTLDLPVRPEEQMCVFFLLQRYLCKWGGESLPTYSPEWRAYRTLLLVTAAYDVPRVWRHHQWYDAWSRFTGDQAGAMVSVVARKHSLEDYRLPLLDWEGPAERLREPLARYDTEWYLFHDVRQSWRMGELDAAEFFVIINWRARRAKSRVANRLLQVSGAITLDEAARTLTGQIAAERDDGGRLRVLMQDWGFLLPLASSVLTVYDPDTFGVYDLRVCSQLGAFASLARRRWSNALWADYRRYLDAVRAACPELALRDADRVLLACAEWRDHVDWLSRYGKREG